MGRQSKASQGRAKNIQTANTLNPKKHKAITPSRSSPSPDENDTTSPEDPTLDLTLEENEEFDEVVTPLEPELEGIVTAFVALEGAGVIPQWNPELDEAELMQEDEELGIRNEEALKNFMDCLQAAQKQANEKEKSTLGKRCWRYRGNSDRTHRHHKQKAIELQRKNGQGITQFMRVRVPVQDDSTPGLDSGESGPDIEAVVHETSGPSFLQGSPPPSTAPSYFAPTPVPSTPESPMTSPYSSVNTARRNLELLKAGETSLLSSEPKTCFA